jgi:hypothetical protein
MKIQICVVTHSEIGIVAIGAGLTQDAAWASAQEHNPAALAGKSDEEVAREDDHEIEWVERDLA